MLNRNPYAKSLRSPHLRQQVIPNKKTLTVDRKGRKAMYGEIQYVDVEVEVKQDRELSYMVYAGDVDDETGKEKWISLPKSLVKNHDEIEEGEVCVISIPKYLCEQKGLEACVV